MLQYCKHLWDINSKAIDCNMYVFARELMTITCIHLLLTLSTCGGGGHPHSNTHFLVQYTNPAQTILFTDDIFIPYETALISSYADPCGSVFVIQDKRMAIERHNGVK